MDVWTLKLKIQYEVYSRLKKVEYFDVNLMRRTPDLDAEDDAMLMEEIKENLNKQPYCVHDLRLSRVKDVCSPGWYTAFMQFLPKSHQGFCRHR